MADAYRKVLLAPQFHRFFGFQWENMVFRYACLPFGLSSSPQIYSAFAECLRQIVLWSDPQLFVINGVQILMNYLDDFFCGHSSKKQALLQYRIFREWLVFLGIPTCDWKCSAPSIEALILGFLCNTVKRTVSIPPEKIAIILELIESMLNNPSK